MDSNQIIMRILVESGVIGRVLADFNPRCCFFLSYGNKKISLGVQLALAEVRHQASRIQHESLDPEFHETLNQGQPIALVMTDPNAPGVEYVHWIILYDVSSAAADGFPLVEVVPYEPPRPGARMIVFTFFLPTDHFSRLGSTILENNTALRILHDPNNFRLPILRENFSTIDYVETNAVGSVPLGAAFSNIKYDESSVGSNVVESEPESSEPLGATFFNIGDSSASSNAVEGESPTSNNAVESESRDE